MPSDLALNCRNLCREYYDLMDNRSAYVNKLQGELRMVFPQYLGIFSKVTINTSLTLLETYTYRGILPCCFPVSPHVPWFSPILPRLNFPFFSFETFLTIRQNSLYVTVCMIARTFFKVTLSTRLAPCITTTHRVQLHGSLAITATGLAPASVVQLCWTHVKEKSWLVP